MGFAPHKKSNKERVQSGEIPTQLLKSYGKTSKAAKVWPYVIIAAMSAALSILFYYVIFPAMESSNLKDGWVFGISTLYFTGLTLLFYFVIEPALVRAFSKSGRFINKEDS